MEKFVRGDLKVIGERGKRRWKNNNKKQFWPHFLLKFKVFLFFLATFFSSENFCVALFFLKKTFVFTRHMLDYTIKIIQRELQVYIVLFDGKISYFDILMGILAILKFLKDIPANQP